jgi:hypothetical protein
MGEGGWQKCHVTNFVGFSTTFACFDLLRKAKAIFTKEKVSHHKGRERVGEMTPNVTQGSLKRPEKASPII